MFAFVEYARPDEALAAVDLLVSLFNRSPFAGVAHLTSNYSVER